MTIARDMTPAAVAASREQRGTHAVHYAVEMSFGGAVKAVSEEDTRPDATITWNIVGGGYTVQTSLDGGRTWSICNKGGRIPGLSVGTVVTGRALLRRVLVRPEYSPTINSITVHIGLDTGEDIDDVVSGADLDDGTMVGMRYRSSTQSVRRVRLPAMKLRSTGKLAYGQSSTMEQGEEVGLHVSRGHVSVGSFLYAEVQDPFNVNRFALASMAIEGWVKLDELPDVPVAEFHPTFIKYHSTLWAWKSAWGRHLTVADGPVQFLGCVLSNGKVLVSSIRHRPHIGIGAGIRVSASDLYDEDHSHHCITPAQVITADKWHHIAFSYDGLSGQIIVDGVLRATKDMSYKRNDTLVGQVIPTDCSLYLGNSPAGDTPLGGLMSEWRLWKRHIGASGAQRRMRRRLLPGEISDVAGASVDHADRAGLESAGLVAYWPLDEGVDEPGDYGPEAIYNLDPLDHYQWVSDTISWETARNAGNGSRVFSEAAAIWVSAPLELNPTGTIERLCDAPFNLTFPDSRVFVGAGKSWGSISAIPEQTGIEAEQVTLTLSGLPQAAVSIALQSHYLDRPVRIYKVWLDEDNVMVVGPNLIFEGRMDTMPISHGDQLVTIQVNCYSHLRDWERPSGILWNHEAQKAAYPDDEGFGELVDSVQKSLVWPRNANDASSDDTAEDGEEEEEEV